jgi:hypothetical protein
MMPLPPHLLQKHPSADQEELPGQDPAPIQPPHHKIATDDFVFATSRHLDATVPVDSAVNHATDMSTREIDAWWEQGVSDE